MKTREVHRETKWGGECIMGVRIANTITVVVLNNNIRMSAIRRASVLASSDGADKNNYALFAKLTRTRTRTRTRTLSPTHQEKEAKKSRSMHSQKLEESKQRKQKKKQRRVFLRCSSTHTQPTLFARAFLLFLFYLRVGCAFGKKRIHFDEEPNK